MHLSRSLRINNSFVISAKEYIVVERSIKLIRYFFYDKSGIFFSWSLHLITNVDEYLPCSKYLSTPMYVWKLELIFLLNDDNEIDSFCTFQNMKTQIVLVMITFILHQIDLHQRIISFVLLDDINISIIRSEIDFVIMKHRCTLNSS